MTHSVLWLQRRRDSLAECAFRHDTVSRLYDVYYSWQYLQTADHVPGIRRMRSRASRRRRRRRRWYLGVDKHGNVRTFRVKSVQRRHSDDEQLEFRLPRRVMFFQRWINDSRHSSSSSSSNFAVGHLSVVRPGWTSAPSAGEGVSPSGADEREEPRKRKQRRRWRCSRLLTRCRQRRRRRRPNIRRQTSTLTTGDVAAVLNDS